jgi:hypothetical protein
MEKDDVGSEYYELKDGSQPALDLDGIISCDSGVDVVDESIEGRVQDSTKREDIFSIPELPSRDGDELVLAGDVDLHYLPLWSTMDAPESISGKCLGSVNGVFQDNLGDKQLTFWDYALLFPDIIEDTTEFRYGFVRSGWQYLDSEYLWSEHD